MVERQRGQRHTRDLLEGAEFRRPESFLPLSPTAFYIMASLVGSRRHRYGIKIAVRELTDGAMDIPTGSLYPALEREENLGLLKRDYEEGKQQGKGRYRGARYQLTELGMAVFTAEGQRIGHMGEVFSRVMSTTITMLS